MMKLHSNEIYLYFDGGIRKGIMACGWLIRTRNQTIACGYQKCGKGTSNISEYKGLILGLQNCLNRGIKIIHIIGDSQLIIRQIIGSFKTKNPELKKYRDHALELLEQFDDYTIKWVPREQNKKADALVDKAFKN